MWMDVSNIDDGTQFILNQEDEQNKGYILEVDLEYPEDLHDKQDTHPCAPEKIKIKKEYLSEYQKESGRGCGVKFEMKIFVSHGMIRKNIHYIIET